MEEWAAEPEATGDSRRGAYNYATRKMNKMDSSGKNDGTKPACLSLGGLRRKWPSRATSFDVAEGSGAMENNKIMQVNVT